MHDVAPDLSKKNNPSIFIWPLLVLVFIVGSWLPSKITVSISDSLDYRVFWIGKKQHDIYAKGSFVLFNRDNPWAETEEKKREVVLKEISCLPGDNLRIENEYYYCNETYLGAAIKEDSKGNPLDSFQFNGEIPTGKYFVSGHNPRSYDSRYFGFVGHEEIFSKTYPIF